MVPRDKCSGDNGVSTMVKVYTCLETQYQFKWIQTLEAIYFI